MSRTVAAVDVGTNSCRLLIACSDGQKGLRSLDRRLRITRLGAGVDADGHLRPDAIARVVDTVRGYVEAWEEAGVDAVGIIATSAARDAANGKELTSALTDLAGTVPRILTGLEEAEMSFRGATSWMTPPRRTVVVVDIGGGSTEVVLGEDVMMRSTSRDIGSVRLTERILHDDPATPPQIAAALGVIGVELDAISHEVGPSEADVLVAVAGTATTLGAIHAGLDAWTDGAVQGHLIPADDLSALTAQLLGTCTADIAAMGPVQAGREDVLAAGALILDALVRRFGFDEVCISEADVLDGLALELLGGA